MPSTSGRPTTATSTREARFDIGRRRLLAAAEATPSARIVLERGAQIVAAEVGPQLVHEHELGVRKLPQEEVRDAQLTGCTDQQIRIGHLGLVEKGREALLVEQIGGDTGLERAPGSLDDLRAT